MKIDKAIIFFFLVIIAITFSLIIITYQFTSITSNGQLIYDFSLGIFCSALVALFVSIISARSKFFTLLNKILFICKQIKSNFDKTYYIEQDRLLTITEELVKNFEEFYQTYSDIDFLWLINCKYKEPLEGLCFRLESFISPFCSFVNNNGIKQIHEKDIERLQLEINTKVKIDFHEFICTYVDLYTIYDNKLLTSVLEWDEISQDLYNWVGDKKLHETINQIINNRVR